MQEKNENSKRQSQDGWYKHKETGAVVHLVDDTSYGVPLTNAYIKAGFVFVGNDDPRVEVSEPQVDKKKTLSQMSKPELLELAASKNVVGVSVEMKNDDIRKLIKEAN